MTTKQRARPHHDAEAPAPDPRARRAPEATDARERNEVSERNEASERNEEGSVAPVLPISKDPGPRRSGAV